MSKSANGVTFVTWARTARPSWAHTCTIGFRPGLLACHSTLWTPACSRCVWSPWLSWGVRYHLEGWSCSQIADIWNCYWLQYLVPISDCARIFHTMILPPPKPVILSIQQSNYSSPSRLRYLYPANPSTGGIWTGHCTWCSSWCWCSMDSVVNTSANGSDSRF
jgi:hypothetical protein